MDFESKLQQVHTWCRAFIRDTSDWDNLSQLFNEILVGFGTNLKAEFEFSRRLLLTSEGEGDVLAQFDLLLQAQLSEQARTQIKETCTFLVNRFPELRIDSVFYLNQVLSCFLNLLNVKGSISVQIHEIDDSIIYVDFAMPNPHQFMNDQDQDLDLEDLDLEDLDLDLDPEDLDLDLDLDMTGAQGIFGNATGAGLNANAIGAGLNANAIGAGLNANAIGAVLNAILAGLNANATGGLNNVANQWMAYVSNEPEESRLSILLAIVTVIIQHVKAKGEVKEAHDGRDQAFRSLKNHNTALLANASTRKMLVCCYLLIYLVTELPENATLIPFSTIVKFMKRKQVSVLPSLTAHLLDSTLIKEAVDLIQPLLLNLGGPTYSIQSNGRGDLIINGHTILRTLAKNMRKSKEDLKKANDSLRDKKNNLASAEAEVDQVLVNIPIENQQALVDHITATFQNL